MYRQELGQTPALPAHSTNVYQIYLLDFLAPNDLKTMALKFGQYVAEHLA
jgi:hypothetical protein